MIIKELSPRLHRVSFVIQLTYLTFTFNKTARLRPYFRLRNVASKNEGVIFISTIKGAISENI